MIKDLSDANSWFTYHRDLGPTKYVMFNHGNAESTQSWFMNDTAPTATEFTVGTGGNVNQSGNEFVAYLFAGGASDEPGAARSVEFDGNSDYLSLESNSELAFGTGDFTIEFWVKMITDQYTIFFDMRPNPAATQGVYPLIYLNGGTSLRYFTNSGDRITGPDMTAGHWYHIAVSRSGTSTRMFLNGTQVGSTYTDTNDYLNGDTTIGCRADGSTGDLHGYMSNVRVVKGTAVYTSSFRPPTQGLTNITNTKLLCCNKNTVTGSTVTPGTITSNGSPQSSTSTPFDDPNGFKFGADEDKGIIKMGSYTGNGSSTGPVIHLGWEPQWLIIKNTSNAGNGWMMYDAMRGFFNDANDDRYIMANSANAETTFDLGHPTATGFEITTNNSSFNASGDTYIYWTIRSSDGYVGKLPSAGTGVFTMDTGNSNGSPVLPVFDSGFPVDFALRRRINAVDDWDATGRLIGGKRVKCNTTDSQSGAAHALFDSNVGWSNGDFNTDYVSWMWKRGQGMDLVAYTGNGTAGSQIPHSLNQVPEMIWVKKRNAVENWAAGHKGLNGGTNPWNSVVILNTNGAESASSGYWANTAPTSTHFTVGNFSEVNHNNEPYLAMLFSSANDADGNPISKVGSYTGNGTSGLEITVGFQPRFVIIKNTDDTYSWVTLDTTRGWESGNDKLLRLDLDAAEVTADYGAPTSTGFTVTSNSSINTDGHNFIYYAHA